MVLSVEAQMMSLLDFFFEWEAFGKVLLITQSNALSI